MRKYRKRNCWLAVLVGLLILPAMVIGEEQEEEMPLITYRQIEAPVICIDQISDTELIINDMTYWRFDGTLYYDVDGSRVNSSRFKVGTCVKIRSDENHRLLALYEAVDEESDSIAEVSTQSVNKNVQKKEKKTTSPEPSGGTKQDVIRKEGGVWKN